MQEQAGCATISEVQLGHILGNVSEPVYLSRLDDSIKFVYVNSAIEELTGYPVEDFTSGAKGWLDIVHEKDVELLVNECRRSLEAEGKFRLEYRITHKDGSTRDVLDRGAVAREEGSDSIMIEGLVTDITLAKLAERQMERTQLLQSIGRLAAGIVHEINTPVQFIGDNIHFMSDSFEQLLGVITECGKLAESSGQGSVTPEQIESVQKAIKDADIDFLVDEIPSAIEQTVDGVKRVSTIVAAMRDFSHIDERRLALSDINKALRSTLTVVHNELKYVAEVETELDKDLPMVMCCIDDLNQVFVNLLVNGAHSIGDVVDKESGEKGAIKVTTAKDGANVVITVSDTGAGISKEVQEKMFEPFFTTKGGDKGTGQGLLFVKAIVVDKHKGNLDWETEIGEGTKFIITLPIESIEQEKR